MLLCTLQTTWKILNWRAVRGDFALLLYAFAFGTAYYVTRYYGRAVESPFCFVATLSAIYGASALLATVLYRMSPWHPLAGYPGPRSWWISSLKLTCVSYGGKRHLLLDDLHQRYGPFLRIGPNTLSVNLPSANIFYSGTHGMEKSDSYILPGHTQAVGLFFKQKTKDMHANRKKIWANAFTGASVSHFWAPLERSTRQLLKCIETRQTSDGTVELGGCLGHWSYDFMGEMVFGGCNNFNLMQNGDTQNLIRSGKRATVLLDSIGQTPWLMDIMWHLPAGSEMQKLRNFAAETMRARIKADQDVQIRDLSSYLIDGNLSTEEKISQEDLELDAMVAIQGGSDNTSTTMILAIYFLLSRPPCYEKLQSELDSAFPDPLGCLDGGKLMGLPFLNAVLNETLRLGSPFFLPRIVPAGGVTVDGRFIPGGTIVAIAAYSQQLSPEIYPPDPLVFRPERWYPDSRRAQGTLYSFSSGPHVCIAKSFAYQEMRYVMARLVLAFDMSLPSSFDVDAFRDGIQNMRTTILQRPLVVKVSRRSKVTIDGGD
ncbi:cytochrome P450 [Hysterangium stoloniferum]|nr:cytochrome P450 [Hysterangium stoloniferum]